MNQWSWASVPACRNTHRSRLMPAAVAAAAEHSTSAAPCSTLLLEFMSLVYGKPTMRLSAVGVATSSGVKLRCIQAWGLVAATSLKLLHSAPRRWRCSSMPRPRWARNATSNMGYT